MEPIYPVPFEAIGVVDFNTVPIVKGQEYEITAVSADGTRWQTFAPDGKAGWFPAKYCVPLPEPAYAYEPEPASAYTPEPVYAPLPQPHYTPEPAPATLRRTVSTGDEARRREREEQRRQEEAKKNALRQRLESKASMRTVVSSSSEPSVEDVLQNLLEEDEEQPQQRPVQTYAATKGYLANIPAFDANLSTYSPVSPRAREPEPEPEPQPVRRAASQQTQTQVKPGLYYKVSPVEDEAPAYAASPAYASVSDDGPWRCAACGTVQQKHLVKCNMCGSAKVSNAAPVHVPQEAGERPFEEDWKCARCSVSNNKAALRCNMCGSDRPKIDPAVQKRDALAPKSGIKPARPGVPGAAPKKKIISKASSGVELEYAKKVDVYNYKSGTSAVPGHGASY